MINLLTLGQSNWNGDNSNIANVTITDAHTSSRFASRLHHIGGTVENQDWGAYRPQSDGVFGPEFSLIRDYDPGEQVNVLKYAADGTSLCVDWENTHKAEMIAWVNDKLDAENGAGDHVVKLVIYQGETDATLGGTCATAWSKNLKDLVADLALSGITCDQIVIVQIHQDRTGDIATVRHQQAEAARHLGAVLVNVDAFELSDGSNGNTAGHHTEQGYVDVGSAVATALTLPKPLPEPVNLLTRARYDNLPVDQGFFRVRTTFTKRNNSASTAFSLIVGSWNFTDRRWLLYVSGSGHLRFLWHTSDNNHVLHEWEQLANNTDYDIVLTYDPSQPVGSRVTVTIDGVAFVDSSPTVTGSPTDLKELSDSSQLSIGALYDSNLAVQANFSLDGTVRSAQIENADDRILLLYTPPFGEGVIQAESEETDSGGTSATAEEIAAAVITSLRSADPPLSFAVTGTVEIGDYAQDRSPADFGLAVQSEVDKIMKVDEPLRFSDADGSGSEAHDIRITRVEGE